MWNLGNNSPPEISSVSAPAWKPRSSKSHLSANIILITQWQTIGCAPLEKEATGATKATENPVCTMGPRVAPVVSRGCVENRRGEANREEDGLDGGA